MTPEEGAAGGDGAANEGSRAEAEPTGGELLDELSVDEEPEGSSSAVEKELAETKNRMLRIAADFDNFRKRARREQDDARVKGREEVLKELLPVFDNLDRAVEAAGTQADGTSAAAIVEGVAMIQKQFEEGLARFGLKRFSALGELFDPSFHEAVAQLDAPDAKPGSVVQELQKGYMLGERLLRAAMVVVARPRPAAAEGGGAEAPATGPAESADEGS